MEQHRTPSRNRKRDRYLQNDFERYIRQRRIPRHSLLSVKRSPWRRVFNSGDPQAMITLTGFDMDSFMYICALFRPLYNDYSPFIDEDGYIVKKKTKRGRPRLMMAEDCLGLVLAWTRTRGCLMSLQLIFGLTMTPVAKYLQFARRILVVVLIDNEMAKITMPTRAKLEEYRRMIAGRHPALTDVWGTMDGLKIKIESAADFFVQSRFYNGWQSDHFVSAVLAFAPDGTIPAAFFNVPGCTHDSTIADWGGLYDKLEQVYNDTGLKFVIDSAFSSSTVDFLIKSSQDYLVADAGLDDIDDVRDDIAVKRAATSMRQSAEWGMRAVQASFPRLKDTLPYEENGERRMILTCLFLLYNCRARLVGINQIASVYLPYLENDANVQFVPPR
jgi:hypothetical protein